MVTLALDLGQHTGWAIHDSDLEVTTSGTWGMTISDRERKAMASNWDRKEDPRFLALFKNINHMVREHSVRKIVFEDVQFSTYTLQTQQWSMYRSAVWAQRIISPFVEFDCLNTSTLKLVATGRGNATKLMMAAWLVKKYPHRFQKLVNPNPKQELFIETTDGRAVDDNEVDAYHLLQYFINA